MTKAVCFNCGELKVGSFTPCLSCKKIPYTDEEFVISIAMTDHYLDEATLKQIGQRISKGILPDLDSASKNKLLECLKSDEMTPVISMIRSKAKSQ